jgi:pyrimidine operon attenuation protein/uracil phosphoribosyltransferase
MQEKIILDAQAMTRAITRISFEIIERAKGVDNLCIIGILSRGEQLSARIAQKIMSIEKQPVPVGFLDITPFRDDQPEGTRPAPDHSNIPFPVTGKTVVLVDDVIYTGRSVRAAIDALMSRGRPQAIQLAVLIDRGHRELPLRPDFVGKNVPTSRLEEIQVCVAERDGKDQVVLRQPQRKEN